MNPLRRYHVRHRATDTFISDHWTRWGARRAMRRFAAVTAVYPSRSPIVVVDLHDGSVIDSA